MKKPSAKARGKVVRPKPFEKSNKVDFSKFKAVPSASDIAKLAWGAARPKVWQQPPIEVLSADKTHGRGWTFITCGTVAVFYGNGGGMGDVVFKQPPGYVAVIFEPSAYGITSVATYIITFNIFVPVGNATFTLDGEGDIPNRGEYTLNDRRTVQAILRNASPHAPIGHLVSLQVKEPGTWTIWRWYSSVIKFADPIVSDPIVNPPV